MYLFGKTHFSQKRGVNRKIKRLKAEMEEISKQQVSIRQGQKEMRERFVEIESECDQLKKETELVSQASDNIQLRLDIMLKILKARQENDFAKAADLTCSLRLVFRIFFSYLIFFYVQLVFASIG
jgi:predicted nuclease with TOPRIM domain